MDEFSNVIFRKENLQSDRQWWLSMFYSLCIQSIVRKGLIAITQGFSTQQCEPTTSGPRLYLHLVLRLFIACAATYDPLIMDWSSDLVLKSADFKEVSRAPQYKLAQLAIGQRRWGMRGISSSRGYLKQLFEHTGILDIHIAAPELSSLLLEQDCTANTSSHFNSIYGSLNAASDCRLLSKRMRRRSTSHSRNHSRSKTHSLGSIPASTARNPIPWVFTPSFDVFARNGLHVSYEQPSSNTSDILNLGLPWQQHAFDSSSSNGEFSWSNIALPSYTYHDPHNPDACSNIHADGVSSMQLPNEDFLPLQGTKLSNPPDLWGAFHEEQVGLPSEKRIPTDPEVVPQEQKFVFLEFISDPYSPH